MGTEARRPRKSWRDVNGILLFDKPCGMTSNAALQRVRRVFGARKAGHTGNLDEAATGLLPVCFGEATKICAYLLESDKTYVSDFQLGIVTTTGDAEGEVIKESPVNVDTELVERVIASFRGPIDQIPPMHSALKRNGKRLYKLAHRGIEIEREPRRITIHRLALLELSGSRLRVEVECSKGTYIRTLAEDIGAELGCGAHVATLRRVSSGPFKLGDAHTLEHLEAYAREDNAHYSAVDELLLPLDTAVQNLPDLYLSDESAHYVSQGQAVRVPNAPSNGLVRLYCEQDKFIGIGKVLEDGRVAPRRLMR